MIGELLAFLRLFLEFVKVSKVLIREGEKMAVKREIEGIRKATTPKEKARLLSNFLND